MKNCIALLGLSLLCALPQAAQAQTVTPPIVPPGLEVDAPDQAFLLGHATGFQNYECQPVDPELLSPSWSKPRSVPKQQSGTSADGRQ